MYTHKNVVSGARFRAILAAAAVGCGLISALPSIGAAQQAGSQTSQLDSRWQPWIGCWRGAAPQAGGVTFSLPRTSDAPLVCVIPEAGSASAVNVLTVSGAKILSRDTIEATGQEVARTKDDCTGNEKAEWSPDGHRLYVSSDFSCPGNLKRTSSGLFAMSPRGDWMNVQEVDAGGNKGVRTLRYVDAGIPSTLPTEISAALHERGIAVATARATAGAPLTYANVIEASHMLDSTVVEAWIVDRGQSFGVDANELVALSDAGVPGNVTDAMVAVTYPKAFAVNPPEDDNGVPSIDEVESSSGSSAGSGGATVPVMALPYSRYNYSPFGYAPYDYYGDAYSPYAPFGYSPYGYSPYGYSPYGYSPYGYSPYGSYYSPYNPYSLYGGAYAGWYSPPVIVLKGNGTPQPRGHAVKGRGYTRTQPRGGENSGSTGSSTASPRPTVGPPPSRPSPPPSTGHTAHRRP